MYLQDALLNASGLFDTMYAVLLDCCHTCYNTYIVIDSAEPDIFYKLDLGGFPLGVSISDLLTLCTRRPIDDLANVDKISKNWILLDSGDLYRYNAALLTKDATPVTAGRHTIILKSFMERVTFQHAVL